MPAHCGAAGLAGGTRGGVLPLVTLAGAGDAPLPGPTGEGATAGVAVPPGGAVVGSLGTDGKSELAGAGIPDTANTVLPNSIWALGERAEPPGLVAVSWPGDSKAVPK